MDVARSLVRSVARAFYDTKQILVIDSLTIHHAIRDDDLAFLIGSQTKDVHKLCGRLKEDRMLHVTTRAETKENQQRPVNRIYYYVDYRATIDAVKYRMHKVVKDVERKMNKDADTKGYVCPRCNKQFAALDVAQLIPTNNSFLCDRCNTEVDNDDDSAEVKFSQERLGRLMDQMKPVIDLLKKIDEVFVPQNEFDDAMRNALPVSRETKSLGDRATTTGGRGGGGGDVPFARGGPNTIHAAQLEINFTTSNEKSVAEVAAEQAKKLAQMEENALPVWHTQSTVSGEITKLGLKEAAARQEREKYLAKAATGLAEEKKPVVVFADDDSGKQQDAIEQYYAMLAAGKPKEEEEEEDEDEDEEDEFEDVVPGKGATVTAGATLMVGSGTNGTSMSFGGSKGNSRAVSGSESDDSSGTAGKKRKQVGESMAPTKKVKREDSEEEEDEDEEEFENV